MKFNIFKNKTATVKNHEGATAYTLSPEVELYSAVVTAGLSDGFYEKSSTRLDRIRDLMMKNDPAFVARLAIYARNHMYMRSVPLVLTVELAIQAYISSYSEQYGNGLVAKTVNGVVQRADEITELLAYYGMANQRTGTKKLNKLAKQVQKGLGEAFNRFDEYQFAKYDRAGAVSLRDALFLTHPKPKNEQQQEIFNKIATKTLAVPYTWETELSALGQTNFASDREKAKAFKRKWEELISSGRLGYMALLRNLRNIIDAEVGSTFMKIVCETLGSSEAVAKAKQMPFRFLAAYREVSNLQSTYTNMVLSALEAAISASATNIRGFDENTRVLLACDVSGSMQKPVSPRSKVLLYDIGLVLAMLMQSKCKRVVSGMFGDTWKTVNMPVNSILANVQKFYGREGEVGYSTNGHLVIDDLINRRVVMDKVLMFTDCQLWDSGSGGKNLEQSWSVYKRTVSPNAKLYLFDLAGMGTTPVDMQQNDVYLLAGWSDKVFDVLEAIENGAGAVEKIKAMPL